MANSNNWGGARIGSGRPGTGENTVPICVRISREAADKLSSLARNKSQYINDLILSQ